MDLAEDERSLTGYGKEECLQRVEEKGENSSRLLNTAQAMKTSTSWHFSPTPSCYGSFFSECAMLRMFSRQ